MSTLGRKISSFIWWTYPRGSLEYDIMVGLILAFIFLTPRQFFHDQPRVAPIPIFAAARPVPSPAHAARIQTSVHVSPHPTASAGHAAS